MKRIFAAMIIIFILASSMWVSASENTELEVSIPTFPIKINDMLVDNVNSEYPFLVYNNITYFPMTWSYSKLLGLNVKWDQENGLRIDVAKETSNIDVTSLTFSSSTVNDTSKKYKAILMPYKVEVNGKLIDNYTEEYPLILFRDVTYFPLTWHFAVEEFKWAYYWDNDTGLAINSNFQVINEPSNDNAIEENTTDIDVESNTETNEENGETSTEQNEEKLDTSNTDSTESNTKELENSDTSTTSSESTDNATSKSTDYKISSDELSVSSIDDIIEVFKKFDFEVSDKQLVMPYLIEASDGCAVSVNGIPIEIYQYDLDSISDEMLSTLGELEESNQTTFLDIVTVKGSRNNNFIFIFEENENVMLEDIQEITDVFMMLNPVVIESPESESDEGLYYYYEPVDVLISKFKEAGFSVGMKSYKYAELIESDDGCGITIDGISIELYHYDLDTISDEMKTTLERLEETGETQLYGWYNIKGRKNNDYVLFFVYASDVQLDKGQEIIDAFMSFEFEQ